MKATSQFKPKTDRKFLLVFPVISLLGLCFLAALSFGPMTEMTLVQKQLTVVFFDAICVMGIVAGLLPSRCSRISHNQEIQSKLEGNTATEADSKSIKFEGHHPICGSFQAHVMRFGDKVYCAGCTGLIVGATVSLIGSFWYLMTELNSLEVGIFMFCIGFVGVACGLLQYMSFAKKPWIHLSFDAFFVVGAFLLLVGVNETSGDLTLGVYLLALIPFWIATRIILSQWQHRKICANCVSKSCFSSFDT